MHNKNYNYDLKKELVWKVVSSNQSFEHCDEDYFDLVRVIKYFNTHQYGCIILGLQLIPRFFIFYFFIFNMPHDSISLGNTCLISKRPKIVLKKRAQQNYLYTTRVGPC